MKAIRAIVISLVILVAIAFACRQAYNRGFHDSDAENSLAWNALTEAGWFDGYMSRIDRFRGGGVTVDQSEEILKDYHLHYMKFRDYIGKLPAHAKIWASLEQRLTNLLTPDAFGEELRDNLEFASAGMLSGDELAAKAESAYNATSADDLSKLIIWHDEYNAFDKMVFRSHKPPLPTMKEAWMADIKGQMKSRRLQINRARFYAPDQLPKEWPISESESKEPLLGYVIVTYGPKELSWTDWPVIQTVYGARLLAWRGKLEWHVVSSPQKTQSEVGGDKRD